MDNWIIKIQSDECQYCKPPSHKGGHYECKHPDGCRVCSEMVCPVNAAIMDNQTYNGPKTKLMDELYELFLGHYGEHVPDEAVLSLYLARSCRVLENIGRKNGKD